MVLQCWYFHGIIILFHGSFMAFSYTGDTMNFKILCNSHEITNKFTFNVYTLIYFAV